MGVKKALIVGATGIIGSHILQHLIDSDDWDAVGTARKIPEESSKYYIKIDLLDQKDVKEKISSIQDITHIFYAAYQDHPPLSDALLECNTKMLKNIVSSVSESKHHNLSRVVLIQGAKVYGAHLGKFKTPAKENDPRHLPPNFYYAQEDFLRSFQNNKNWDWSILRPDLVAGISIGNPMNIAMAIAVYASISKALGLPLKFPGKEGAYRALIQITDALLLARAATWVATSKKTSFEVFNITNGDLFRWEHLWPKIAKYFDMECAPIQTISLSHYMPIQEQTWLKLVDTHNLKTMPYSKIAAWPFADFILGSEYDVITDTTKIKQYGFHEVIDSERQLLKLFDEFREQKLIP